MVKGLASKLVVLLFTVAAVLLLSLPPAQACAFVGEITWTMLINEDEGYPNPVPESYTMKAAISRVNNTYFSLQGVVLVPDDNPIVMSGGGVIVGDEFIITLNAGQQHTDSWRDVFILHARVNRTTLNGPFFSVGISFEPAGHIFDNDSGAGTLTVVGTPPVLTTSLSFLPLLLDN